MAVLCLGFAQAAAHAEVFEVDATGVISGLHSGPNYTFSQAATGQPISFRFLFDTSAPAFTSTFAGEPISYYTETGPNYGVASTSFGGYSLSPSSQNSTGGVTVEQANPSYNNSGSVDLISYYLSVNGQGNAGEAFLNLSAQPTAPLSSTAQPQVQDYNLSNFTGYFYFTPDSNDSAAGRSTIDGSLTSLSAHDVSAAPEPSQVATLGFIGISLAGLMLCARKRQPMESDPCSERHDYAGSSPSVSGWDTCS